MKKIRMRQVLGVIVLTCLVGVYVSGSRCSAAGSGSGKGTHVSHKNEDGSYKYTNRLKDETSPYLLQHAHNPVDWWPWGRKLLLRHARRVGRFF